VLRHNVIDLTKESEQLKRENKRLLENKRWEYERLKNGFKILWYSF
jgi:hypothetical protein